VSVEGFDDEPLRSLSTMRVSSRLPHSEFPLGVLEVFIHGEDAERFIEEVQGDDPEVAANLRIEERELEVGGLN
jgi:hypothetical protein